MPALGEKEWQEHAALVGAVMSSDHGESAVFNTLRLHPETFGAAPVSKAGASRAEEQSKLLSEIFAEYQQLRDANDALLQTKHNRSKTKEDVAESTNQQQVENDPRMEPDRKARQDFMEEWRQRNATEQSNAPAKKAELGAEVEPEPDE